MLARSHSLADVHLVLGRQMPWQRLAARAVVQPLVDVGVAIEAEQSPAHQNAMTCLRPAFAYTPWTGLEAMPIQATFDKIIRVVVEQQACAKPRVAGHGP